MRKHIQKVHAHVKTLHKHLKKPAQSHHYIAFMIILAGFAILSIGAFVTYAADEQLCDATMTDCSATPVVDSTTVPVADYTDESNAKAIVKLKINTLPVYQKLYGKNSKEVRGLKKLITSLTKIHNDKKDPTEVKQQKTKKIAAIKEKNKQSDATIETKSTKVKAAIKTQKKSAKTEEVVGDVIQPIKPSVVVDPLPPVENPSGKTAMTWVVRDWAKDGVVNVGNDATTNAYAGDTDINQVLPMLCVNKQNKPTPSVLTEEYKIRLQNNNQYDDAFYNGWIGGYVQMTTPIAGNTLTSLTVANQTCVDQFGEGWEFAEFHSPQGGRGRFAYGELPVGQRLWVGIRDQASNPWGAGWVAAPKVVEQQKPTPAPSRKAMTWIVRERAKEGVVNVGNDATTNAYQGDTDTNTLLPMLCMNKQDMEIPSVVTQEYELRSQNNNPYDDAFYNGWIGGYVQMTTPIVGSMITSHDVANKICVNQLGEGWEFAEFHSPQGGRGRFAYGEIPAGQRLWVGIRDQASNPWGAGW